MKRSFITSESKGSVESVLTILPQLAIFLLSLQLISMQFIQSSGSYLENNQVIGKNAKQNIGNTSSYVNLIGGGRIIVSTSKREHLNFYSKLTNTKSQTFSVVVDEASIN
jgi:hypothetical protein